jgi:uncharacterized protein YdeI (BOF family)
MKVFMTALVLAALVTTPAFAAKKRNTISPQATAAYASVDQNYNGVDRDTVFVNGRIVGRDPDPNVRLMLMRDPFADAS